MSEKLNIDLLLLNYYDLLLKDWIEGKINGIKTPLIEIEPSNNINTEREQIGFCNKYTIIFTVNNNISITFPNNIKFNGGTTPTYVENRTYEVNVYNNLATINEFY